MKRRKTCCRESRFPQEVRIRYGKNLEYIRKLYDYKLRVVAEVAYVSVSTIFKYEAGFFAPSEETEKLLCNFYHIEPEDLLLDPDVFQKKYTVICLRQYLSCQKFTSL